MRLFPLFADLRNRAVLVVGGGDVAARKIKALLDAGAVVTAGSLEFLPQLLALAQDGRITLIRGGFEPAWLDGMWLVIAATDDRAVNAQVSSAAALRHILANVVDDPELSSFQVPSIVDRAPLVIAISSSGAAPVLARRLRERMEALFDHSLGALASLAQRYRGDIRRRYADMGARRRFYDWMFDGPVAALLRSGKPAEAEAAMAAALLDEPVPLPGRLVFVGAGPGPASLLTLQGLRALNEADIVIYEKGVHDEVLALARRDAEIEMWETAVPDAAGPCPALLESLAAHARRGGCVVHLQSGDALRLSGAAAVALSDMLGDSAGYDVVPGLDR